MTRARLWWSATPSPDLTAHDKDGKLLFDGEIDTPEQRAKVPPELWEKVEPLLDKIAPRAEEEPDTERVPSQDAFLSRPTVFLTGLVRAGAHAVGRPRYACRCRGSSGSPPAGGWLHAWRGAAGLKG